MTVKSIAPLVARHVVGCVKIVVIEGAGLIVTEEEVLPVQPIALVTVTVYIPAVFTLIACVVAPLLQAYVEPLDAVKVADAPLQMIPSLLVPADVSVIAIVGVTA